MTHYCIIITGPTGVGKTAVAEQIAQKIGGEIINCDVGQWYVPLTIGTAKPAWRSMAVAHHMFDMLASPTDFSVTAFRTKLDTICQEIWQRNKIPMVVGGSLYYIAALFFPPVEHGTRITKYTYEPTKDWWQELRSIDPQRAAEIDQHDTYRIERALDIWRSTGIKPSQYKPTYNPLMRSVMVWLTRERRELYDRIDERVIQMIDAGWIDEVRSLIGTAWEPFLLRKKIIGYPEVIAYCHGEITREQLVTIIQQKTRHYAKRQMTFWRMLSAKINAQQMQKSSEKPVELMEVNLTHTPIDSYIKQLVAILQKVDT